MIIISARRAEINFLIVATTITSREKKHHHFYCNNTHTSLMHHYKGRGQLKKNVFFWALPELPNPPPP